MAVDYHADEALPSDHTTPRAHTAVSALRVRTQPAKTLAQRTILLEGNPLHLANRPLLALANRIPLPPTPWGVLFWSLPLRRGWTGILGWWGWLLLVSLPACGFGRCVRRGGVREVPVLQHTSQHTSHNSHHTSHITQLTTHYTHHTSHITHHTTHITHHTSHTHHTTHLWHAHMHTQTTHLETTCHHDHH